jgi:tetratricopeptide (TPR) repeat protein
VATVLHRQERFPEALASYERAYEQLVAAPEEGKHRDPERERARIEGLAVTLTNLSTCLIIMNDFDRALDTYRRARAFCEGHGMPTLVALVDYNIAYLYYLGGSTARRLSRTGDAGEVSELDDDYHSALSSRRVGDISSSTGRMRAAAQGASTFERLGTGYEAGKARLNQAIACAQLGKARLSLGLFREARRFFTREKSGAQLSVIDLYRALVLFEEGRYFEARRIGRRALRSFRRCSLPRPSVSPAPGPVPWIDDLAAAGEGAASSCSPAVAPILGGALPDGAVRRRGLQATRSTARSAASARVLRSSLQRETSVRSRDRLGV